MKPIICILALIWVWVLCRGHPAHLANSGACSVAWASRPIWHYTAIATREGQHLQPVVVEAEGVAAQRAPRAQAVREATQNALLQAIESVCGVRLARFEVGRDGALQSEAQLAFAQGIVLRWQLLGEPRIENDCLYVRVRAEVVPIDQLQTPADWREVWQTVGHPPIALKIRYLGEPALETHVQHTLRATLMESLKEMGVQLSPQTDAHGWQLIAEIQVEPLKRWDETDAPYNLGDLFASWHARLLLQVMPPATNGDQKAHLLIQREAKAVSFTGDREAVQYALRKVVMQPDANWRITLATLWINQILERQTETHRSQQKEVQSHAKRDTNRSGAVSANRKRPAERTNRR